MTETKWTPGPWSTKAARRPVDGEFDWGIVATIDGVPRIIGEAYGRASNNVRPNAEANARLISAAPDMAKALERFLDHYVAMVSSGDCGFWNPEDEAHVKAARSALAKARGET